MGQKLVFDFYPIILKDPCNTCFFYFYPIIIKDPRNTDNAWIETVALHFHDEKGDKVASPLLWTSLYFQGGCAASSCRGRRGCNLLDGTQLRDQALCKVRLVVGLNLSSFRLLSLQKTDHHTFQPPSGCQGGCGKVGGTLVNKGRPNKRKSKIYTAAVLGKQCIEWRWFSIGDVFLCKQAN